MQENSDRSGEILEFEDFELDNAAAELRKAGELVPVEPQVFDLIAFLAMRPNQIVTRDDILADVWGGRIVSESAISTRINAARKALSDSGSDQRLIKTVHGRGFRFECTPKVRVMGSPEDSSQPFLSPKPTVAVLAFESLSGDPERSFLAEGIREDISTELSRYSEVMVIAAGSLSLQALASTDHRAISSELGVSHVISGSVRISGDKARVSVQLLDATSAEQIWAERFDRSLDDIFEVQEEIAAIVVNLLVGKIAHRTYERSLHKKPDALDAYENALRALVLLRDWDRSETAEAVEAAARAVSVAPDFAWAHALLAWSHLLQAVLRWSDDPGLSFKQGHAAAMRAVELDYAEPWAHAALGFSELWGRHDHASGLASLEHAIELNPNNAHFRVWYSNGLCLAGNSEAGLHEIELAMRLNPKFPPIYLHFLARILATLGRYEDALRHLGRATLWASSSTNTLALAASCHAAVGRTEEAKTLIERLLAISPSFRIAVVPEASPYANPEDLDRYIENLRLAGLPE
ncbi:MAG: winged helix-turn-helix domain-containing protein [Silicimonas sp.]|nr:winged helix-turn-helix domain-containing protein [Silicimonas sp.]